jgi:hypothetical protein
MKVTWSLESKVQPIGFNEEIFFLIIVILGDFDVYVIEMLIS